MFRGITALNLDDKGRIAVPTRYRENLLSNAGGELVLTIDTEAPCLLLYPLSEWELIENKLQQLPSFDPQTRRIQRLLIGHANELEMDSQGRVTIQPLLRDYADLNTNTKVVLVGQGKKFEIWNEQAWHAGRETWLANAQANGELPEALQTLIL